ncbi:MAG: hypothetical protein RBS73_01500 [Prolixibacteraceae bacterium]|jgi:uncharacterized membrane protein (DUF485 family)|nr:hypothetical protein [Prolixibacteraceae bacterium]
MRTTIFTSVFILVFWAGFVSAISFMEAWLKFQAPGVTLEVGLGIGIKVFKALNLVEWVLLIAYLSVAIRRFSLLTGFVRIASGIAALILAVQSFVVLPVLTQRALSIIAGEPVEPSFLHVGYVVAELIKVSLLILLAFKWSRFVQPSETYLS